MSRSRLFPGIAVASLLILAACGGSNYVLRGTRDVANAVALADLDGDGRLDVISALAQYGNGAPHPGFLSVRFQQTVPTPSAPFKDPVRFTSGDDPYALATGDLNGDGRPDLVIANTQTLPGAILSNTLTLRLSDTTPGTFQPPLTLALGTRDPLDVAVGDLNHDGLMDIAVASRGAADVQVFLGTLTDMFLAPTTLALSTEPTALLIADLNGDGYQDLAATTAGSTVDVRLQVAATPGTFSAATSYPVGQDPVAVKAADLNGDGRPDLAVANAGSATGGLSLLRQNAASPGTFLATTTLDTRDALACALALADLDGDGSVDIVVANAGAPGYPGSVAVFRQGPTITGLFPAPTLYQGYSGPFSVAIGDLDGDGRPDLALSDGTPTVRFQDSTAPGSFFPPVWLRY